MIRWYKELYLGAVAKKKHYRMFTRINKKKLSIQNPYIITLPQHAGNILEVISYNMLVNDPLPKLRHEALAPADVVAVGIGYTKDDAYEVMQKIIMEVYDHTGDFDISSFILSRDPACNKGGDESR